MYTVVGRGLHDTSLPATMSVSKLQFNVNCTNLTIEQLKDVNLTRGVTAMVCAGLVLFILVFLVCHKAFSRTFQRLYIYLLIVTFLVEVFISLSIEHQFQYSGQKEICVFLGFATQWLSVIKMMYTFETIVYLLCLVVISIHEDCFHWLPQSKFCRRLTEVLLALLPVLCAFIYSWEPYIGGNRYGLAGPFCWIRSMDETCRHVGTRDQMIYYGLYEMLGVSGFVTYVILSIVYCRLAPSLKEARYLLRQTLIVLIFQFAYTLAVTFQLGVRLYTGLSGHHIDSENSYSLWLTFSFVSPIRELLFPIGCFICFYPVKAVVMDIFWKIWKCCFKLRNSSYVEIENPDITRPRHATVPESTRISQPSSTFFVVPHPDDYSAVERFHGVPYRKDSHGIAKEQP